MLREEENPGRQAIEYRDREVNLWGAAGNEFLMRAAWCPLDFAFWKSWVTITEIVAVEEFSQMLVPRGLGEQKLGRKEET